MAKVKVTSKFKILELVDSFVDGATANAIGQTVADTAKDMIASGQSPVRGYGRFTEYSERYKSWIKNEAKTRVKNAVAVAVVGVKKSRKKIVAKKAKAKAKKHEDRHGKKVRPINLYLTGEMLDAFDFKITGDTIEVGMVGGSSFAKDKAGWHNEGTENMPQRKLVPGKGEEWATTIMRAIRDVYGKRLVDLIRQSNKKS